MTGYHSVFGWISMKFCHGPVKFDWVLRHIQSSKGKASTYFRKGLKKVRVEL
jgi:hypothetical protein